LSVRAVVVILILFESWCFSCFFFFFSSRRRHTRFKCDWSSDVCSSDLGRLARRLVDERHSQLELSLLAALEDAKHVARLSHLERSEERRVGKECRSRWSPYK